MGAAVGPPPEAVAQLNRCCRFETWTQSFWVEDPTAAPQQLPRTMGGDSSPLELFVIPEELLMEGPVAPPREALCPRFVAQ